ncbi:MAG: indolepyruvate ferredoxin oxidoreductase subunit alpha [Proteobacteria bacterium]|nr:indolepyruvate ferredoxin oxidoreductase subunit alpha [Pseudomonadota bacterium]
MERSFTEEVELLKLGEGDTFNGEGILAVTKALLQSGVSYVGGYQGAPVSHMMDVLNDARDIMDELGIHIETNASEAGAAAMLGASINYPIRGAVTWKSTVGTNVASDALSNLASAGVKGGALIVIGEDYGEGSSIIQERSHAFATKSQIWLLDPRPNLTTITNMVEKGFELSEASSTPVFLELRIRACHVHGSFKTKANKRPLVSTRDALENPDFDYSRICLPPATYAQEKQKIEVRWPAAVKFIREHKLNEFFDGDLADTGIICQGGLYNATVRALQQLGLADEESILATLRRHEVNATRIFGKQAGKQDNVVFPLAGEYTGETVLNGVARFVEAAAPRGLDLSAVRATYERLVSSKKKAADMLGVPVPARPPGFCVGCPERPVFSAMKLVERDQGKLHISADIGCHLFSTLPPFNIGNTVLGYGLGLASNSAIDPLFSRRTVTIMGDGGFWHNGLTSGIANSVFNRDDGILVIMKNGYTSATGTQNIPSSPHQTEFKAADMGIERTLKGLGVSWMKTVNNYHVADMAKTLRDAMTSSYQGLKVIIAEGECQLERQRRIKPINAAKMKRGERVLRTRFGVDEDTCSGDHSCIRLSGCPSLTIKASSDPLKVDPVAHVNNNCVGCGLCGEVAHAAILCPSFYRAEIVQNANAWDRFLARLRTGFINLLQPA